MDLVRPGDINDLTQIAYYKLTLTVLVTTVDALEHF